MLDRFLEDELKPRAVELNIIIEGQLDKLLEALRGETKYLDNEPQLSDVIGKASILEKKWRVRFDTDYDQIDAARMTSLNEVGALHHIILNERERPNGHRFSISKDIPVEYIEVGKYAFYAFF
jgi:hypothetical protein